MLPSLTRLNFSQAGVFLRAISKCNICFRNLFRNLQHLTALQFVDMSGNNLGAMGVLGSFGALCSMRSLILRHCGIELDEHKDALQSSIAKLHSLQKLDLSHNLLGSKSPTWLL